MNSETEPTEGRLKHPVSIIEAAEMELLQRIAYHEKEAANARRQLGRLKQGK